MNPIPRELSIHSNKVVLFESHLDGSLVSLIVVKHPYPLPFFGCIPEKS